MLFKEAVSNRIYDLCEEYNYSPNKLAEMSAIAPSTLRDILTLKVSNPSSYVIYRICKTLKITLQDFYNDKMFDFNNLDD